MRSGCAGFDVRAQAAAQPSGQRSVSGLAAHSAQYSVRVRQLGLEQFSNLLVGAEQRAHWPIVLASSLNSRCMRLSKTYSEPSQSPWSLKASPYRTIPPSSWYTSLKPRFTIRLESTSQRMPPVQ